MQTLRRLYIYSVAFVSLETVLWGAIGLARSFVNPRNVGGENQLAEALSLILVGIPVFLLHWWWLAQRGAMHQPGERSALLRAIFLYGILLATLVPVVNNALALLDRLLAGLFGLDTSLASLGGGQTLSDNLIAIAFNAVAAGYFYFVLREDWKAGPLGDEFAEIRRLYRYIWAVYSLGMTAIGLQRILEATLLWLGVQALGWLPLLISGLALLLVGLPLCAYAWWVVQRSVDEPAEGSSLLRLGVLFALVIVSAVVGLLGSVITLQTLIQFALAQRFASQELFAELSTPLSVGLTFGLIWLYFRRMLQSGVQQAAPLRAARLRRLSGYLLALFGLFGSFLGAQMLLFALIDLALADQGLDWGDLLQEQVSVGIAFLLVGIPVWLVSWRPLAREAAVEGESGDTARRSLIRRGYLYLVLFAGVMGVMFASGIFLFTVISTLLGEPPEDLLLQTLQGLLILLLFIALLVYHGLALRQDGRMLERSLVRKLSQYPVLLLAPESPEFVDALVGAIEREAPGLPVAVQPISQGAPDETMSAAKAVVLPGELLAKPPEALRLWLQAYSGQRVVLPTPADGLFWVTADNQSISAQARRTARLLRSLAGGE